MGTITIRKSADRGTADHGWLKATFSFSFSEYHDANWMGFRNLRVMNQDRIAPKSGFPMHSHRDMEIITYVINGVLAHEDSAGNKGTTRPGDIQRMSAGTGITHSEFNLGVDTLELIQIWIQPDRSGHPPRYHQNSYDPEARHSLLVSPDGKDGSIQINQDVRLYRSKMLKGDKQLQKIEVNRYAWIQLISGSLTLNGQMLQAGDGAALTGAMDLEIVALDDSVCLTFDLN